MIEKVCVDLHTNMCYMKAGTYGTVWNHLGPVGKLGHSIGRKMSSKKK